MLIIGIAGGTGSGKTTVVNQIIDELKHEEVDVISQDSYYQDTSHLTFEERKKINFDHPKSIDFLLGRALKEQYFRACASPSPQQTFIVINSVSSISSSHEETREETGRDRADLRNS